MFKAKRHGNNGLFVLDMGTHEVRAVALQQVGDSFEPVSSASGCAPEIPSGSLPDLESVRGSLGDVLQQVAWDSGVQSRRVIASVGGAHVRCVRTQGRLQLRRAMPLRDTHVQRVLDLAADLELPRDHEVLHVVPTGFCVDDVPTARPPLGMCAASLLAETSVVTVSRLALDNLERVLESLGWQLVDAAAEPLLVSRAALTDRDRQRGAVLIDIGGEATHASVYREGALRGIVSLAAGSAHVTRDLSWALRVDHDEAEKLKRQHGVAVVQEAKRETRIEVRSNGRPAWVGQRALAQVIEPRLSELLTMARDGLRAQDALFPAARVVLTGNGARIAGLPTLVERIFETPAHTATFLSCEEQSRGLIPSCVAAGLIQYASACGLAREEDDWCGSFRRGNGVARGFEYGRRDVDAIVGTVRPQGSGGSEVWRCLNLSVKAPAWQRSPWQVWVVPEAMPSIA